MQKYIKITVFLSLALSNSFSMCMEEKTTVEKHKELLAQQKLPSSRMRSLNRRFGHFLALPINSEDAPEWYKPVWMNIQNELNISQEDHLPLKAISSSSLFSQLPLGAMAEPNAMLLGAQFSLFPLGMQRQTLLHEAVHHKYLDAFNIRLFQLGLFSSALLATNYLSKMHRLGSKWYIKMARIFGSISVTSLASHSIKKYIEHRADVESAHAVKCHECLKDVITTLNSHPVNATRDGFGYLTAQDFEKIAEEDERNGNICKKHAFLRDNPSFPRHIDIAYNMKSQ